MRMAKEATAHVSNVAVLPTGDYLISSATFPDYFIRDVNRSGEINCALDLEIFARHFAKPLGIDRRFVGTEPHSRVTRSYNEQMKALLPQRGVRVIELERVEAEGGAVSAGRVRALLDAGRMDAVRPLVPGSTYRFLEGIHDSTAI
jgi:[citrate (pro-3S)-lyase] ligase